MKVRAIPHSQNVVVEMGPRDASFPPAALPELRLKTILVPIDFSEASRKAMAYADSFGKQFNSELLLFHAAPIIYPVIAAAAPIYSVPEYDETLVLEEATKQLSKWQHDLSPNLSSKVMARQGASAYAQIVSFASEQNVDLIVIGTHGRSGAARWLIGSTAEKVVRHAPCPVLVVREREHDFVGGPERKNESVTAE